ncbi:SDR family oxidoreductase [Pseudarthrobacter sp. P1]|uniref:SDR family oxidoreductase n=1 Tax=Pseudarthrobacter sp. P1 TaxID=3418418 RepID=UPI003CFA1CA5
MPQTNDVPTVLIAGGSSAAGVATAAALLAAGMRVLTVGSDAGRIGAAAAAATERAAAARAAAGQPGAAAAVPLVCDLADRADVERLAVDIHRDFGPIDGLVQLVGGWRGGKGIVEQSDEDWDVLHRNVVTTLRNTSRTFYPDLAGSPAGRLAIVSSTSVTAPTAGNANYAAAKAAAEAWTQSVAQGLAGGPGAAVVLVVKALVDDGMRAAAPERSFPGFTDVADLARAVAGLFSQPAEAINGARILL